MTPDGSETRVPRIASNPDPNSGSGSARRAPRQSDSAGPVCAPREFATLGEFRAAFEIRLRDAFEKGFEKSPKMLRDACAYALFPGGKRIRPALAFLASDFLGVPVRRAMPFALAIECAHCYSLIHDDLPCMDDDAIRRGKPAAHIAFGEATAILAGDALSNFAHEILFDAASADPTLLRGAKLIAEATGAKGMVGGQAKELAEGAKTGAECLAIGAMKTGAPISAAIMSVATLSDDAEKTEILRTVAKNASIAFQLSDDILDAEKDESPNYAKICGVPATREKISALYSEIESILKPRGESGRALLEFCSSLATRSH